MWAALILSIFWSKFIVNLWNDCGALVEIDEYETICFIWTQFNAIKNADKTSSRTWNDMNYSVYVSNIFSKWLWNQIEVSAYWSNHAVWYSRQVSQTQYSKSIENLTVAKLNLKCVVTTVSQFALIYGDSFVIRGVFLRIKWFAFALIGEHANIMFCSLFAK